MVKENSGYKVISHKINKLTALKSPVQLRTGLSIMVPEVGLEPTRREAGDFESLKLSMV
jgi:hypothetical protein